jgi:hypothetical protein
LHLLVNLEPQQKCKSNGELRTDCFSGHQQSPINSKNQTTKQCCRSFAIIEGHLLLLME